MKNNANNWVKSLFVMFAFTVLTGSSVFAQTANVTFKVNTAFVPDTIYTTANVSIRGAGAQFGEWSLKGDGSNKLTNVAGDYWTKTFQFNVGDTLKGYKLVTQTASGTAWDKTSRNSEIIHQDTTIWFFGSPVDDNMSFNPLNPENKGDSIAVLFRVNTSSFAIDKVNDKVHVRGGHAKLGDWGAPASNVNRLAPEPNHGDLSGGGGYEGNNFYSKVIMFPPEAKGDTLQYKFTIDHNGAVTWEDHLPGGGNASFILNGDTTLYWRFFDDGDPITTEVDTSTYVFKVNVAGIQTLGIFNPATDSLTVPGGFNGWNNGEADPLNAPKMDKVSGKQFDYIYVLENYATALGNKAYYKIYIKNTGIFPRLNMGWLESAVRGGANYNFLVNGEDQDLPFEYAWDAHPSGLIPNGQTVNVTFSIDMKDEMKKVVGKFDPAADTLFLTMKDPIFSFLQKRNGNTLFNDGNEEIQHKIWLTDANNDSIFTAVVPIIGPTRASIMYSYQYRTINEGDNGFDSPIRYRARVITPSVQGTNAQPSTFPNNISFKQDKFGRDYFEVEVTPWGILVGVKQLAEKADRFELNQNYPNPFNPSTKIPFSVSKAGLVKFEIFNVLGQKITSFEQDIKSAGVYQIDFNGSKLSSGTYLYKMTVGNFSETKKMLLVK